MDSLRVEVLKSSRPKLRASVYKDIYREMQAKGFEREAALYMQHYINELELLFTSGSRAELLEIEKKYDYSAVLRQSNDYRSRWTITILITIASVCTLALLLWGSWKFSVIKNWISCVIIKRMLLSFRSRLIHFRSR